MLNVTFFAKHGSRFLFFSIRAAPLLPVFVCPIIASSRTMYLFAVSNQNATFSPHPVFVCLRQNATDSSSNSSQKLEISLQPLESSPLPQRHRCMLGRHDLHDPYRLSDHYFLDQVRTFALALPGENDLVIGMSISS